MGLGLFVVLTVASSWADAAVFFSDDGVLPRETLVSSSFGSDWLCFHLGAGAVWCPRLLNGLLALFGLGLAAGWRTPWMGLGCWILLNSLQVRNPFVCDRGDLQLELMLFWGLFLPLGARWSLDARASRASWGSARGIAAGALVAQLAQIYLFAAYFKNGPFWLGRGDGLEHSLLSPLFATPLSLGLAQAFPSLLPTLNYLVLAGEVFVAMLLLSPFSVPLARGVAVVLLVVFHLSVGALFTLGLFPWLGAMVALGLLPSEFWEGGGRRLAEAFDRYLGGQSASDIATKPWKTLRDAFLLFAMVVTLLTNIATTSLLEPLTRSVALTETAKALRLSQHWELFSPIPPYHGWFVLEGADGAKLFEGPPTRQAPNLEGFPSHRWRMLMIASLYPDFALIRPGLVRALAERAGRGQPASYQFRVHLPSPQGELEAPVTWILWAVQAETPSAPSGPEKGGQGLPAAPLGGAP
jgi:hypothetical protein